MSSFTKTITYNPTTMPLADVLDASPLKADGTPGNFSGNVPAWGPSSDPTVVALGTASSDGLKQNISILKEGTATFPVTTDGVTTTVTVRVNPTFAEIDVNPENTANTTVGPLTPAS